MQISIIKIIIFALLADEICPCQPVSDHDEKGQDPRTDYFNWSDV